MKMSTGWRQKQSQNQSQRKAKRGAPLKNKKCAKMSEKLAVKSQQLVLWSHGPSLRSPMVMGDNGQGI